MLQLMSTRPMERVLLTLGQALVGSPIDTAAPVKWWDALHAFALWYIWLARNEETRQHQKVSAVITKIKIWQEVKLYMKVAWKKRRAQYTNGPIKKDKARYVFHFEFGDNKKVFTWQNDELVFARIRPCLGYVGFCLIVMGLWSP